MEKAGDVRTIVVYVVLSVMRGSVAAWVNIGRFQNDDSNPTALAAGNKVLICTDVVLINVR